MDDLRYSVSAIIPAKGRPKLLERAIESVLSQSYHVDEIIVIDDGSYPPLELSIDEKYVKNLLFIRNEVSKNAAFSRNQGAKISSSKYLAFLDSDDQWKSQHLEKSIHDMIFENCEFSVSSTNNKKEHNFKVRDPYAELFEMRNDFRTSGYVLSRNLFLSYGGFDELQEKHQDWDLALRIGRSTPILYRAECTILIDSTADDRMSSKPNISASERFLLNHAQYMKSYHIGSFSRIIAAWSCLNNNALSYKSAKDISNKYDVKFGTGVSSLLLWYFPKVYKWLLKSKLFLYRIQ